MGSSTLTAILSSLEEEMLTMCIAKKYFMLRVEEMHPVEHLKLLFWTFQTKILGLNMEIHFQMLLQEIHRQSNGLFLSLLEFGPHEFTPCDETMRQVERNRQDHSKPVDLSNQETSRWNSL